MRDRERSIGEGERDGMVTKPAPGEIGLSRILRRVYSLFCQILRSKIVKVVSSSRASSLLHERSQSSRLAGARATSVLHGRTRSRSQGQHQLAKGRWSCIHGPTGLSPTRLWSFAISRIIDYTYPTRSIPHDIHNVRPTQTAEQRRSRLLAPAQYHLSCHLQ